MNTLTILSSDFLDLIISKIPTINTKGIYLSNTKLRDLQIYNIGKRDYKYRLLEVENGVFSFYIQKPFFRVPSDEFIEFYESIDLGDVNQSLYTGLPSGPKLKDVLKVFDITNMNNIGVSNILKIYLTRNRLMNGENFRLDSKLRKLPPYYSSDMNEFKISKHLSGFVDYSMHKVDRNLQFPINQLPLNESKIIKKYIGYIYDNYIRKVKVYFTIIQISKRKKLFITLKMN